jgi:fructokinase
MQEKRKAAAFGEILWDILPDRKCLGGAPFNCGAHLNRLGFETSMVSALGNDELGRDAVELIKKECIRDTYLQIYDDVPTGFTTVTLENGIPSYEFNSPCAWDRIAPDEKLIKNFLSVHWNIFCFGSLAQRSETSRTTLTKILSRIDADIVFFDVNLRKKFFTEDIIRKSLECTDILKMNDEEVPVLSELLGFDSSDGSSFIYKLIEKYALKGVIVTLGKKGVCAYFDGNVYTQTPSPVKVADTVGAGDSFSAAFLASFTSGHSVQDALAAGTSLADFVVSHYGALPEYDTALRKKLEPYIGYQL